MTIIHNEFSYHSKVKTAKPGYSASHNVYPLFEYLICVENSVIYVPGILSKKKKKTHLCLKDSTYYYKIKQGLKYMFFSINSLSVLL